MPRQDEVRRVPFFILSEICSLLDPTVLVKGSIKMSLWDVSSKFPNIILESEQQQLDCEWCALLICGDVDEFLVGETNTESFWSKVHASERYPTLSKFARALLCEPVSNADCERISSLVNLMKSETRNRLPDVSLTNELTVGEGSKKSADQCML